MRQLRNQILVGDARDQLKRLPAVSVDCVITSPPYFQLRDYGMSAQMGLEASVESWTEELRLVMRGIARILRPTGSVWLNLGDSYSRQARFGAPPKSLLLGPERLGIALIEDGWTIRNKVIWCKSNTMPNSVRDRLACRSEVVYLLTRSRQYFFDLDAIRQTHLTPVSVRRPPIRSAVTESPNGPPPKWAGPLAGNNSGLARLKARGLVGHPLGKNPGDVWTISASNFRGPHFATFPAALVERPLRASCPERVCVRCGTAWTRSRVDRTLATVRLGRLQPGCGCRRDWRSGVVLDPFFGSGTVGLVAEQHGRDWLGIELNPEFAAMAQQRIEQARANRAVDQECHRAA